MRWRAAALAALLALAGAVLGHQPRFPDGPGPYEVEKPQESQAFYLRIDPGGWQRFVLPPLPEPVPVQLLVIDDDAGRAMRLASRWLCNGRERALRRVDRSFYEPYTGLEMRYRMMDVLGPSGAPCELWVWDARGDGGPYVLAVGHEERFALADLLALLTLDRRLEAWRRGEP